MIKLVKYSIYAIDCFMKHVFIDRDYPPDLFPADCQGNLTLVTFKLSKWKLKKF